MSTTKMSEEARLSLFESLINFSDDAIITKTLDGIITSWNRAAELLFGFTYDEIIGKHISIIIPPDRIIEEQDIIKKIINGEQVRHYETERLTKNGSTVFISLTISPVKDKNGVITGASKIARDITKQKQEEHHLRLLESVITNTTDAVLITEAEPFDEPGPRIIYVNESFTKMTGYLPEEVIGKNPRILQGPRSDKQELKRLGEAIRKYQPCEITTINYKKNGEPFWINFSVNPVTDKSGRCTHFIAIERDVTHRKNEELQKSLLSEISLIFNNHTQLSEALHISLKRLMDFGNFSIAEAWLTSPDEKKFTLSASVFETGEIEVLFDKHTIVKSLVKGEGLAGVTWETAKIQFWDSIDEHKFFIRKAAAKKSGLKSAYGVPLLYNSVCVGALVLFSCINEKPEGFFDNLIGHIGAHLGAEIKRKQADDARKNAEAASRKALEERNLILESIDDAFFAVDKNWIVTYWNNMAEKVLGKLKNEVLDHNLWEVYADSIDSASYTNYHTAMETGYAIHFEDYYPPIRKWYEISAYPADNGLSVYFKDVTERKTTEIQLKELNANLSTQAKELEISNAELEQFAYVASHDLQEPLRMITSFLTQLEKKYGDIIDAKGKKYIFFAVDGAKRMRQIILDLLEFSRVGRTKENLEEVSLTALMNDILVLFRKQLGETQAVVTFHNLPTLQTYKSPMRQVFQNLVGNGLKYNRPGVIPVIDIVCEDGGEYWQFSVSDNGIGIDEEYFDKIFIIFQRLHNKDEYSGTGMGLAVTKKIIENMGGKIWVASEVGKGSVFYFTILKNNA